MKKFLKYKIDLVLAVIWLVLMVLDIITKSYNEALMSFIIATCSAEIYILKQESNQLKIKSEGK